MTPLRCGASPPRVASRVGQAPISFLVAKDMAHADHGGMMLTIPMQRRTVRSFQRIEARPLWREQVGWMGVLLCGQHPLDPPPERVQRAVGPRLLANHTVGLLVGRRGGDDRPSMGWTVRG